MHGDVTWDHFDRLIEAYAAACLYIGEVRELEMRISRSAADLLRYTGTFEDLTALLATRAPTRDMVTRRVAWTAQHLLGKRAWCVGSKVIVKLPGVSNGYASPLLDQLRMLGLVSAGERESAKATTSQSQSTQSQSAAGSKSEEPAFEVPSLDKVDALCCASKSDEVWLVKGCSYSQIQRSSPDLWVNADRDSLFGLDDRFMTRLQAPGGQVRTLLAARDLVQAAFPQLKVRACYLITNDPGLSWHFQAHDLTSAKPDVAKVTRVALDKFPVLATHRNFESHFTKDALEFAPLPDWAGTGSEHGGEDPIASLPADRPVRSMLMLQELWGRQINRPRRLVTARGEDLAEAVARTTAVGIARDQWRHDLEDCLERGGFARRLPDRPGRFAITPKGVARLILLRRKLGAGPDVTASQLLSHVTHQARLWAQAPVA